MRSIPALRDRPHLAGGTRDSPVAAGSKSARRGARDYEEIPRNTEGPAGTGGSLVRTETAAAEEESEPAEASGEEELPGAVRHNAQLLLVPTVLRDLRGHIQRRRDHGQVGRSSGSLPRRGIDRRRSFHSQSSDGRCVPEVRPTNTVDDFRRRDDDLHGRPVALSLPIREGNRHGGQRDSPGDLHGDVYIHEHPGLPGDPVRHGGRSVPVQSQRHIIRHDSCHRLSLQCNNHQDVSGYGEADGHARRVPIFRDRLFGRRNIHPFIPARNEGQDPARDRGHVLGEEEGV